MGRIRPLFLSLKSNRSERQISLALVNHWIEELRGIPYGFSQEWKTPREVEEGAAADCNGKVVTLYRRMENSGSNNLRLAIGKRTSISRIPFYA